MSVLVDTSAWVEYFRRHDSAPTDTVRSLAATGESFLTCGPITMEVLAGAATPSVLDTIHRILALGSDIPVDLKHFEEAADLYRACRTQGFTIRSLIDCLIAVLAMAEGVEVLHHDRDFNAIAQVVPLRIHPGSIAP
jgi:predicted nucleic acid-binding protein